MTCFQERQGPSPVGAHVQRVLKNLGVGSRLEAAALAARTGLLDRAVPLPHTPRHTATETGREQKACGHEWWCGGACASAR